MHGEDTTNEVNKLLGRQHHIAHCFDYLRQAIMCAGDLTLEWAMPPFESTGLRSSVDGWGITHQCKNWDDAVKWATEYKAPQEANLGIA